jgi:hypothetical protein
MVSFSLLGVLMILLLWLVSVMVSMLLLVFLCTALDCS